MSEFWKSGPNRIESEDGAIRRLGRAGLEVTYRGETVAVSSEMLAGHMSIVIYTQGHDAVKSDRADEILDFVRRGLESDGFTVEMQ